MVRLFVFLQVIMIHLGYRSKPEIIEIIPIRTLLGVVTSIPLSLPSLNNTTTQQSQPKGHEQRINIGKASVCMSLVPDMADHKVLVGGN